VTEKIKGVDGQKVLDRNPLNREDSKFHAEAPSAGYGQYKGLPAMVLQRIITTLQAGMKTPACLSHFHHAVQPG
jgi:hypothetical protein